MNIGEFIKKAKIRPKIRVRAQSAPTNKRKKRA